jgi:hypothetical protein
MRSSRARPARRTGRNTHTSNRRTRRVPRARQPPRRLIQPQQPLNEPRGIRSRHYRNRKAMAPTSGGRTAGGHQHAEERAPGSPPARRGRRAARHADNTTLASDSQRLAQRACHSWRLTKRSTCWSVQPPGPEAVHHDEQRRVDNQPGDRRRGATPRASRGGAMAGYGRLDSDPCPRAAPARRNLHDGAVGPHREMRGRPDGDRSRRRGPARCRRGRGGDPGARGRAPAGPPARLRPWPRDRHRSPPPRPLRASSAVPARAR